MKRGNFLKHLFSIVMLCFLCSYNVYAVHVFGGELEANCTGGGNYNFKLTLYVDCSRVAGMPVTEKFDVYDVNNVLVKSVTLNMLTRDTLPVIANVCAQAAAGTCVGRVVLTGTDVLPAVVGGYTLAYTSCCRNSNISNLVNPGSTSQIYILKLPGSDVVNTCNSAAKFTSLPPSEICTNMAMSVDFSATDADGDLLKYRLVNPLGDANGATTQPPNPKVTFSNSYSYTNPLGSSIQIDSLTGIITGTPKTIGLYVIGVEVEEWRNGKKIGSKIRDFTYTIVACSPQLSTNNPTVSTCANLPVQFDYTFAGALKAGTTPKWNFGDPASGANNIANIKNPTHQYTALGTYYATVEIKDFCDNTLNDTVRVDIVETKANVQAGGPYCKGDMVTLTSSDAGCTQMTYYADATTATVLTTGCTHTFTLNTDSQCVYFEPFVDPTVRTVGANGFQSWGTDVTNAATFDAVVPLTIDGFMVNGDQYWNGCTPFAATISVMKGGQTIAGPVNKTIGCDGSVATTISGLNFKVPVGTGYSLKITGATLKPTTGSTVNSQLGLIKVNDSGPFYNIKVSSDQKCAKREKICVKSDCPCPDTSLKFPAAICSNVDFDLATLKTNTTSPGTWSIVQKPSGNNSALITGTKFNANKNGDGGQYKLLYKISGGPFPNCIDSNIRYITVNKKDTAKITRNQGPFCLSDGVQNLKKEIISSAGVWSGNGITDVNAGKFDPLIAGVGAHKITYTTSGVCSVNDTITIVVVSQKFSNITTPDTSVCRNAVNFKIRLSTNSTAGGLWVSSPTGMVNVNGNFQPQNGVAGNSYKVYYVLQGATLACSAIDSVTITLNPIDTAKITLHQGPFCIAGGTQNLQLENISHTGVWSGNGITNTATGIFNPATAGAGLHVITYTTDGSCKVQDTVQITVKAKMISSILTNDTTVCKNTSNFSIRLSNNSNSGGVWLNGLTSATAVFNPTISASGSYKLYYAVQGLTLACSAVDSVAVTVKDNADASLVTPAKIDFCPGDTGVTIHPTIHPAKGLWWSVPSGLVNSSGKFNPATMAAGKAKVYYGIAGMCGDTSNIEFTMHSKKNPKITAFGPLCKSATAITMQSVDVGSWSVDGISQNASFLPADFTPGWHKVKLNINDFCPVVDSIQVEVKDIPSTRFTADTFSGCIPLVVNFDDGSDSTAITSSWLIVQNNKVKDSIVAKPNMQYNFSVPGCYDVVLKNQYAYGCESKFQMPSQICVEGRPKANFEFLDLPKSIEDPTVNIQNLSSDAFKYCWLMPEGRPDTSSLENPYVSYLPARQDTFQVTLVASNSWCGDTITKDIIFRDVFNVYTPNAFSPNGDGKNDVFLPLGRNMVSDHYEFLVFNRWGELIYRSMNPGEGWNGKRDNDMRDAQIDVYVWKLVALDQYKNKKEEFHGIITLVR